ncbi:ribosomal protein S16 [Coniophora puteana RWD-64-598 SS2]|uniref:Ribosomal protein S16 n=1 Tax=Coniophora puteana (strain RWD-64-598) TaxID=741705 RepID=A0A5M3N7I0_CONPW|nr:ribosomal protein S16 [Coniophora puteana RWD-64-598 SS2]EIW86811.1 ribosomal protein S16 [Coniophora puteana RWD-64-598 SS2]
MAIRIRLAMHGTRSRRIFHLVAIDQRKRRDAKPAELLGVYNPHLDIGDKHKTVQWSVDRIKYWLGVGAVPSKSAVRMLEWGGVLPPDSKYHPKALSTQNTPSATPVPPEAAKVDPSLSVEELVNNPMARPKHS